MAGPEPVGVRRARYAGFQQSVVAIDGHKCIDDERHEAQVIGRRPPGRHQQQARVGAERPVVVLTRAVNALERLFVKQYAETVTPRHLAHQRHDEQVMVVREIALLVHGCQLELIRGHFVVPRLDRDAEPECFDFEFFHESSHAVGDSAEIVILELLVCRD